MTDETIQVFLKLPPEVEEGMQDLDINWEDILGRDSLHVSETVGSDPVTARTSRAKEPVTILLASAGLAMALAPALSRVLGEIFRRPIKVTERILIPVEDSKGQVLLNADGTPIMQWVERSKLLGSTPLAVKSSTTLKGPLQLELTMEESHG